MFFIFDHKGIARELSKKEMQISNTIISKKGREMVFAFLSDLHKIKGSCKLSKRNNNLSTSNF